jgi:hypothetical protein
MFQTSQIEHSKDESQEFHSVDAIPRHVMGHPILRIPNSFFYSCFPLRARSLTIVLEEIQPDRETSIRRFREWIDRGLIG